MTTDVTKATTRPLWAAELSDREWLFVEAYAAELSGVEAALAAGYTKDRKAAREQACRLRKRPHVQEAITRLLAERVGASKARVIDEISSIAFAEPSEAISVTEKLNALALLSKVLGLQVHKTEVSGPGGQPMTLTLEATTARERIAARLDAIASHRAAALPAPMIDVTPVRAAPCVVPARPQGTGQRE